MSSRNLELVIRVLEETHLGTRGIAQHTGVSIRTAQRWRLGQGVPFDSHLQVLGTVLLSEHPQLARELLDEVDASHRSYGLPLPPRPDRNAIRNEPVARMADAALVTAAQMLGVPAETLRPAFRAALATALRDGASLEALITGLDRGAPR